MREHARILEAMGIDSTALPQKDTSDVLDLLDEALNGNERCQDILKDILSKDSSSPLYSRLEEKADSGNPVAISLMLQLESADVVSTADADSDLGMITKDIDLTKVEMPEAISTEELLRRTLDKGTILAAAEAGSLEMRARYLETMNSAYNAVEGNVRACYDIANFLFNNEQLAQLYDPYMAYQWYALGVNFINEYNYQSFFATPGGDIQGTIEMFHRHMAEVVLEFGSKEQKLKALSIMKNYMDKYRGAKYLEVDRLIYALLGMPPCAAGRKLGYVLEDIPINRELAIKYYKQMINDDIFDGLHERAKLRSEEFEQLLGIKYYNPYTNSLYGTSTSSSGACYIATCVYGSYDCPQVWTLRRYRDNVLAKHMMGRLFIRCYYAISPHLVNIFSGFSPVCHIWRGILDKIVGNLNEQGVENTPYED